MDSNKIFTIIVALLFVISIFSLLVLVARLDRSNNSEYEKFKKEFRQPYDDLKYEYTVTREYFKGSKKKNRNS